MGSKYQASFFACFDEVALLFTAAGRDHPKGQVGIVSAKREFNRRLQSNGFNQLVELGLGKAVNLKRLRKELIFQRALRHDPGHNRLLEHGDHLLWNTREPE